MKVELPRHPLARLALQQLVLVGVLGAIMAGARALTGRQLRGLADAPTGGDLVLYGLTIALLVALSRAIAGAPPGALGLGPTRRRCVDALLGFAVGAAAGALPWALALLRGDVAITEHLGGEVALEVAPIALGLALAAANAWFEEATSRAAPLVILRTARPWCAVLASALCFALMHGIGEVLSLERLLYLGSLGVILGAVWILRGDLWLGAGLHAGWFWASLVPSGRFHGGALLALEGRAQSYVAAADLALLVLALLLLGVVARRTAP